MTVQQKLVNNKWIRLSVSVFLTLAVLLVFVFSPFAQAHAVGALGTELIDIIIAGLSACGITFTTTGGFGSLEDYVSSLIDEYAIDQNTTALGLFNGVQYGNNKLGQLLLNNRFVREISAFASWLRLKFNLLNNSETTLEQAGTTIDSLIVYELPIIIATGSNNPGGTFEFTVIESDDNVYGVWRYYTDINQTEATLLLFSDGPATVNKHRYSGNSTGTNVTLTLSSPSGAYDYYYKDNVMNITPTTKVVDAGYVIYTPQQVTEALTSNKTIESNNVGIGVSTGVINPPLDDTDYEDGDGALVNVGSTWGATLKDILDKIRLNWQNVQAGNQDISMDYAPEKEVGEQLPEQTDIENLPGGTAWNPTDQQLKFFEFESIWHYVAQWISDFSSGASVVWNAAMQLPSPLVNMVYAMVTLSIIFGVIKVMRA